jgi:hypothetical protein
MGRDVAYDPDLCTVSVSNSPAFIAVKCVNIQALSVSNWPEYLAVKCVNVSGFIT